jgi:hypothetical protein
MATVGRPDVPTTLIVSVCEPGCDHDLEKSRFRARKLLARRSTVRAYFPST